MRKLFVVFLAVFMITGFAMAQDQGIGITAALEFGVMGVNKPNDADVRPYLMPVLSYGNSFGAFDLYTEFDYTFELNEVGGDHPNDLYWDLALGYNFSLNAASTLSVLLENENDITFAPLAGASISDLMLGTIRPGLKFDQKVANAGNIYAQIDAPIGYFKGWGYGNENPVGLDYSLGWGSTFGLGLKAKVHTLLAPSDAETGYTGFDIKVTYEKGSFFGEVDALIANDKNGDSSLFDGTYKKSGVAIIPKVQYTFIPNLSAYVFCAFANLTADTDMIVTPALGVQYSF